MGAINKIPGVSGGIVAIIFGFYEKLILSFSRFDVNSLTILRKEGFKLSGIKDPTRYKN